LGKMSSAASASNPVGFALDNRASPTWVFTTSSDSSACALQRKMRQP